MKMFKITLVVVFVLGIAAFAYAQGPGMMGSGQGKKFQKSEETAGAKIFNVNCIRCHPNGGNVIVPNLPLRGSSKLSDFKTFLAFIRNPKMPDGSEGVMPVFSQRQISDKEATALYRYITYAQSTGTLGGGYGMGPGMMGGYGMGPGMMGRGMMGGGYGMGPGMMGGYGYGHGMMGRGYYRHSEECQKFLDDTAGPRKELYNKRFEYSEAYRNPKTTQETLLKLDKEIAALQNKIYEKAPLGCGW